MARTIEQLQALIVTKEERFATLEIRLEKVQNILGHARKLKSVLEQKALDESSIEAALDAAIADEY